jgi:hypothetical protein
MGFRYSEELDLTTASMRDGLDKDRGPKRCEENIVGREVEHPGAMPCSRDCRCCC